MFIAVAAGSASVVALFAFVAVREYRLHLFEQQARRDAQLALLSARGDRTVADVQDLVTEYRDRGGFETVATVDGRTIASSSPLVASAAPRSLHPEAGKTLADRVLRIDGAPYFVLAGRPAGALAGETLYFFFPRRGLEASLEETRTVLLGTWLGAVLLSGFIGGHLTRRTLQPVRDAAEASRALADGLLPERLPASDDEFGLLATAFNEMSDALQEKLALLEAAAERERAFTADVAHELRTPLSAMNAAAAIVEDHVEMMSTAVREAALLLVEDARRLSHLVDELLELARFDAGQETARLEPTSVGLAVEAVVRSWHGQVAVNVSDHLYVIADRSRFRRVLGNLVDNAFRHGARPVEIRAVADDHTVQIHVVDHGTGVPAAARDRVFQRFAKLDEGRGAGSGLGLAIARENARAQGGDLRVLDNATGGATFVFSLPRAEPPV